MRRLTSVDSPELVITTRGTSLQGGCCAEHFVKAEDCRPRKGFFRDDEGACAFSGLIAEKIHVAKAGAVDVSRASAEAIR